MESQSYRESARIRWTSELSSEEGEGAEQPSISVKQTIEFLSVTAQPLRPV